MTLDERISVDHTTPGFESPEGTRCAFKRVTRKAYDPGEFGLGVWVSFRVDDDPRVVGQVWAVHPRPGRVWIATGTHFFERRLSQLQRIADCQEEQEQLTA